MSIATGWLYKASAIVAKIVNSRKSSSPPPPPPPPPPPRNREVA